MSTSPNCLSKGEKVNRIDRGSLLWRYDLPHIGAMCEAIQEWRGVTNKALKIGFRISDYNMTHIRQHHQVSAKMYARYFDALMSDIAAPPLTSQQVDILLKILDASEPENILKSQQELDAIVLGDIKRASSSIYLESLQRVSRTLAEQNRPALILDDLWFIHAVNGALFELFGIDPNSKFLNNWEAWHSLAVKFHPESLVREGYKDPQEFLLPVVQVFFNQTYRYLFTPQMRYLLYRLHLLSQSSGLFDFCWKNVTAFSFPYTPEVVFEPHRRHRAPKGNGPEILTEVRSHTVFPIRMDFGRVVNYRLVTWNHLPGHRESETMFKKIQQSPYSHTLHYAADYDIESVFHVNSWQEVRTMIDL